MAAETAQTQVKQTTKVETKEETKQESKPEVKAEAAEVHETSPFSRIGRAESIIRRNVLWALGAGVLPFPIVDAIAVTAVEVKLLKELSDLYEVKFTQSIAKKAVGSLLAGLGSVGLGAAVASLVKAIPTVGTTLGVISVPLFAGAFTHAVGRVFLMHFESGGTFLDFDPHKMRSHFRDEFERARETVAKIQKEEQAKVAVKIS